MITKILKSLLPDGQEGNSDPQIAIPRLFVNMCNFFMSISALVIFLVTLALAMSPMQYLGALLISIIFGALYFLSKKINFSVLSYSSLAMMVISTLLILWLFPDYGVFSVYSFMVPAYVALSFKEKPAFWVTVLFMILFIFFRVSMAPLSGLSCLFYVFTSVLLYLACVLTIRYCCNLLTAKSNEHKALEDDIRKKHEFISKLSHRIRTPLSNILGITNILEDNNAQNRKQLIDSLIASVKTITDIVEIIDDESAGEPTGAASSKAEAEAEEITTFDLKQLITQTGEFTQNFEVKLEVYGKLPLLRGNAVKIRRIFLNIFDFFLQNTPKDQLPANVTIAVNRVRIPINPIKYRFDIKSDIGMPELSESDVPELTIAKRLVEALNGNIKRRFEDDITCIYFNICFDGEEEVAAPSGENDVPEVITNETTGYTSSVKQKDLSEANVIVCDDNPINQKVMSLSLDKHVKTITLASNGQECVDLLLKNSYDVILMDIQMPVLDGYGATQKIREMEKGTDKHIPVIAVTANTLAGDKQHCLSVGMDDYVSKPFQLEDVLNKMRDLISKFPQG